MDQRNQTFCYPNLELPFQLQYTHNTEYMKEQSFVLNESELVKKRIGFCLQIGNEIKF